MSLLNKQIILLYCFLSEVGGRTLYRLLVRDAAGETEGVLLNETVPPWVVNIVVDKNLPQFIKIPFYLLPHASSGVKSLKKYVISLNENSIIHMMYIIN